VGYFVGSEGQQHMPKPTGGTAPVPGGRLHAIRPGCVATQCGIPLGKVHRWPDIEWVGGLGRGWCRSCSVLTSVID
jgi:hypothetical protein